MKTFIIGHQKPDTDSVVAALAFKYLFDHQQCWNHPNSIACIADPLNPETAFIFKKFDQPSLQLIKAKDIPAKAKIVLVDHNEAAQRLKNLNPNQITDIFDHHKINLDLDQPIFATFKTWGSTCTIAWYLMNLHQLTIPKQLSTLMLSAILSDTVAFKSSTTTTIDKQAAANLAKISAINIDQLAFSILKAKSNLSHLTNQQIITKDYKIYQFGDKKIFINQLETVEPDKLLQKKSALIKALIDHKLKNHLSLAFIAVSDILKVNTKLLMASEAEKNLAQKAFGGQVTDNLLDIGPKLSRKKDIVPALEKAIHG